MPVRALPRLLLALAIPALIGAEAPPLDGFEFAQLTIHQRLIIRIPRMAPAPASRALPVPPASAWKESRGPRCLATTSLTGAAIGERGEVDLIVEGVRRVRAKLTDNCPTLDFYSSFYLEPTRDGKICAGRDAIRSRSGARCGIDKFRTLSLKR